MMLTKPIVIIALSLLLCACGGSSADIRIDPELNACSLLPSEFVSSVQGDSIVESQAGTSLQGELMTKRCFYRTENFNQSVDVDITADTDRTGRSRAARDFWDRRFNSASGSEEEEGELREKREAHSSSMRDEEEEERARPKPSPVTGLGDEAFWVSNQFNSTLYLREDGVLLRISLGGPDDAATKLQRARSLAERILSGLKKGTG
jgi:hypothetical protein